MEKAYKIVGMSRKHPGELPKGFRVEEKMVGEVHQVPNANGPRYTNFVEAKNGDVIVYREGVQNSDFKVNHADLPGLVQFLNRIWVEHTDFEPVKSKCPGTPHRGHSASDWSCWMDRA